MTTYKDVLAHWIAQQKSAERACEEAKDEGELWFKRAKFAMEQGRMDLASQAKERAILARDRYERAARHLAEVSAERERIANEAREAGKDTRYVQATERANATADAFRKLGVDPAFAALEEQSERGALDALAAPIHDENDAALDRLRERMTPASDAPDAPQDAPNATQADAPSASEATQPGSQSASEATQPDAQNALEAPHTDAANPPPAPDPREGVAPPTDSE